MLWNIISNATAPSCRWQNATHGPNKISVCNEEKYYKQAIKCVQPKKHIKSALAKPCSILAAAQESNNVRPHRQTHGGRQPAAIVYVPKQSRECTNKCFIVSAPYGAQSALPLTLMMPVLSTSSVGLVFRKKAYCAPERSGQTI